MPFPLLRKPQASGKELQTLPPLVSGPRILLAILKFPENFQAPSHQDLGVLSAGCGFETWGEGTPSADISSLKVSFPHTRAWSGALNSVGDPEG